MGPPHLVLQALGVGDLADITLEELKDKIIHAQPEKPPREQLLQILMGWLHEQIKKDIQQKGMLADFVNLLLSGEGLQQQPFEQSEIRAAYKEMQSENPAEFSVQRRRYEMVESDMNALFRRIDSGLDPVAHSSVDTHIPVDINNGESEPQWIVGGGKRKSGANEIPLGQRAAPQLPSRKKARHDNVHRKLLKINKENERVSTRAPKTDVPDVEQPSNLAGELMIMNEANLSNTLSTSAPDTSTKMVGPSSISPPESYICKRCKGPGHWIQFCPTNLDPRWDTPPPLNYKCSLCKKCGVHFATLCPLNEKEDSLTKQRQRYEARLQARPRTPTREDNFNRQDRRRRTPPSRHRSRSPRDRSRRKGHDIYRPNDTTRSWSQSSNRSYQRDTNRSSSPRRMRESMTRESTRREEQPRDYSPGSSHRRHRYGSPSSERLVRRAREMTISEERPRPFMGPKKYQQDVNEGRLSYENNVLMGSGTTPVTTKETASSKKDEVMTDALLPTQGMSGDKSDELERAKAEADQFLDALALEILSDKSRARTSNIGLVLDESVPTTGVAGHPDDKVNIRTSKNIGSNDVEDSLASSEPSDPHAQERQFGPIVTNLFKNLDNPIINKKPKRKTAIEMMDECYQPTLTTRLPTRPHHDIQAHGEVPSTIASRFLFHFNNLPMWNR